MHLLASQHFTEWNLLISTLPLHCGALRIFRANQVALEIQPSEKGTWQCSCFLFSPYVSCTSALNCQLMALIQFFHRLLVLWIIGQGQMFMMLCVYHLQCSRDNGESMIKMCLLMGWETYRIKNKIKCYHVLLGVVCLACCHWKMFSVPAQYVIH